MKKFLLLASFFGLGLISAQNVAPATANFTEGFENADLPENWAVQNLSAPIGLNTTCWNILTGPSPWSAQAGVSQVGANFNCTAGAGTISGWLFSPVIFFNNGDKIKFWTRAAEGGGNFPDRLEVRLSTNDSSVDAGNSATSVGDFTTLLLSVNPTLSSTGYPEVYTEYTAVISGLPSGVNGRVAFRYFVTNGGPAGINSNLISVDTFSYENVTLGTETPSANKIVVYPNPTSDYLHFSGKVSAVQVFDAAGRIVKSELMNNIIDVRNLASGIYFVKYKTDKDVQMQKIIKK